MSGRFSSKSKAASITLHRDSRIYIAGEHVTGMVELDLELVPKERLEKLKLKLRGGVET
jgi:hypothetical protein